MEIVDSFRIVLPKSRRKIDKWSACKTPEKEFIIKGFSKNDFVYYEDLRTNISCHCEQCSQGSDIFSLKKNTEINKRVYKEYVVITQRKAERERDIKLKLILRK